MVLLSSQGTRGSLPSRRMRAPRVSLQLQLVAEVDGLEDGAQGMVAVGPPAGDLQAQVDLGE